MHIQRQQLTLDAEGCSDLPSPSSSLAHVDIHRSRHGHGAFGSVISEQVSSQGVEALAGSSGCTGGTGVIVQLCFAAFFH